MFIGLPCPTKAAGIRGSDIRVHLLITPGGCCQAGRTQPVMTDNIGNGMAKGSRLVALPRGSEADVVCLQELSAPVFSMGKRQD